MSVNTVTQLDKGQQAIRIIKRDDIEAERAEKQDRLRRHYKAAMILLADLEPELYLEVAHSIPLSNTVLTEKAA